MRILHISSSIDPVSGGTAVALAGLVKAEAEAGLKVSVLATWQQNPVEDVACELEAAGVKVHLIGAARGKLSRHPKLPRAVQQEVQSHDLVHIHGLWEEIQHQAAVAGHACCVPYIFRPCGMLDPWSLRRSNWKKKLYMAWRLRRDLNGAAALHFTADAERDGVFPLGLAPPAIVEPNGVELKEFQALPPKGAFRQRYPQLQGKFLLLFLSRIHPKKGLDILVPAFARAQIPDSMLVIAGPDSDGYAATAKNTVRQHGLEERVVFTGMLRGSERVAALADADLFVLPSYQENFGIAVVESLAAGTPVIISDQVNIHGEISAARVGEVIPLEVECLTRELQRWARDSAMRAAAAARSRPFVWEKYDWRKIAQRWTEHYARMCNVR